MDTECIFCKIAKREIPKEITYENDNFMSFADINPVVKGHSIVISKKHFQNNLDLPNSLGGEFLDCVKKTAMKIIEKTKAQGFNLHGNNFKVAGQLVNHFHVHILPRKEGDGFKPCA